MTSLPSPVLHALLAQSSELLVVSDVQGRIVWANPAFQSIAGRADCAGQWLPPMLAPDEGTDSASLQNLLAEALLSGHLPDAVVRLQPPTTTENDPGAKPVWLRIRIGHAGQQRLWTMSDVRAERAEQAHSRRLEELLDTAQEFGRLGVWERNIATGQGRWDQHVFRYWGLDPTQGTPSFDDAMTRVHPEDRLSGTYADSTRRAGRYSQRYRVFGPDGDQRWIHSQWEIKATPDGRPTHAVGVMVDDTEVMAMAHSLDDASAQLALAVELGHIAVWRHDLRSNRMFYNPRGFEVLGMPYRPEGLTIEEVRSHIHPDDLPAVVAAGQHALLNPGPTDMEARYHRSDGVWRHVLTRRVVQRDAKGKPVAFIGVALDMTDSVERQRETDDLRRRLEYATATAGIGVWSRDPLTEQGHWDPQMYRLCDRAPELGAPGREEWLEQVVHPDDRAAMRDMRLKLMAATGDAMEYEFRILTADGDVRWLASRARLETWNGRTMMFGVTLDVTQRRLADQALREANDRVTLATRGAGIATWDHDLPTDEVRWDAQMYVLRGLTMPSEQDEIRRAPHALRQALAHPDELPLLLETNRRSLAEGTMASYEFRVRWPDGSYRWLASRSIPVYDEAGRPVRQIGVNWDIQERVDAEAARREALAAQRQSEAKSQFLARMSHELRTPLNAILGFTQLLEFEEQSTRGDDPPAGRAAAAGDQQVKLRHIREASEHLLALVNEALDLSSIEAGELRVQAEPVVLHDLVQQVLTDVGPAAQAHAVKLHAEIAGFTVLADPVRLRQVMVKLLGHRIRLINAGSTIQVDAAVDGADVVLSIGDNGQGPTPAQQLNLFDPFGRVGVGDVPDGGMNLALVKALVACMSGRIELDTGADRGPRFLLWLPQATPGYSVAPTLARVSVPSPAAAPVALPASPAATASAAPASGKVLYIEDNLVNVILVEELIAQRGGLELVSENTGEAGVARAQAMQPDLVLIDMQLPDFDGFEVLRRLRADPSTAAASCIALSANAMPDDVARALAAGFDDYWTKPIRFSSFLAGLDGLFPPARAA